jgi:hypothetical protein
MLPGKTLQLKAVFDAHAPKGITELADAGLHQIH